MLAATKVKMSGSEKKKVNGNTYDFSFIKLVTRNFFEVSCCSPAKQRQRNVQKMCAARANLLLGSLDLMNFLALFAAVSA